MVTTPRPRQTVARILSERYWPTRIRLEETDMDDEGLVQETTSYKEPGNVDSVSIKPEHWTRSGVFKLSFANP